MNTRSRARSDSPADSRFARRESTASGNPELQKSRPSHPPVTGASFGHAPEWRVPAPPPRLSPLPPGALTEEAAQKLLIRYKKQNSPHDRNRLLVHYMRTLVPRIAARLHSSLPHQVDVDDLTQEGYKGLTDALSRFDLSRNIRFTTYGTRRILGSMRDYLRRLDSASRLARSRSKKFAEAIDNFYTVNGRRPQPEEIRLALHLTKKEFALEFPDRNPPAMVPFNSLLDERNPTEESDALACFEDHQTPTPPTDPARRDLCSWLIQGLDRRDRLIVILYYYETLTMKEVGGVIGCSESRVSQRLESILDRLRAKLKNTPAEQDFHD